MRTVIFLVTVLCTAIIHDVTAQEPDFDAKFLPKVLPAAPQAASLGKYGVWPVSQYTGIPNISIPLYNINISQFSLSVSLSYHAGGVKIDEKASWVGTNWSLSAGGMIGRTVVGLPDEDQNGMARKFKMGAQLKPTYDLSTSEYDIFLHASQGSSDLESDIYYYNFGNYSGKFIIDSNYDVRTMPASNLKFLVTPFSFLKPNPPASTYKWVVADDQGNIYRFANDDHVSVKESSGQVTREANGACYLTQVILANRADTINFEYVQDWDAYAMPYTHSYRYLGLIGAPNGGWHTNGSSSSCTGSQGPSFNDVHNAERLLFNGLPATSTPGRRRMHSLGNTKLNKIIWRGGQIQFFAGTSRVDMLNAASKMLDSIVVLDYSGAKIKTAQLKYAYVNGRYYLDTLLEYNRNVTTPQKHSFDYINRTVLPPSEPLKSGSSLNPFAQDHWGYYNGATANTSLLPSTVYIPSSLYLNSNRRPDSVAMQCGTLYKITYPTGGYSEFKYEANHFDRASSLIDIPPDQEIPTVASAAMVPALPAGRSTEFQITAQHEASIWMHFNDYAHPPNKRDAVFPYVKIQRRINGTYQSVYYWDGYDNFPTTGVSPNPRGFYDFTLTVNSLLLIPGDYRLVVNDSCPMPLVPANCLAQTYPDIRTYTRIYYRLSGSGGERFGSGEQRHRFYQIQVFFYARFS